MANASWPSGSRSTASTLTTISVFGPIIYVEGVAGELFGALSLAVAGSLLVSRLVALTLLPRLGGRWDSDTAAAGDAGTAKAPHHAAWLTHNAAGHFFLPDGATAGINIFSFLKHDHRQSRVFRHQLKGSKDSRRASAHNGNIILIFHLC
jgi:multidrug efflux pump subunit AcrB